MIMPIRDYDGYFVSDLGIVYSNLGKGNRNKSKTVAMYTIKPRLTKNGYARVYMRNTLTGKRKDVYIHRLVAEHYITNPQNKKYVNHINCKRDDNRVENLEWCTAKENTKYTENNNHVVRNKLGRFVSNFNYSFSKCG